MHGCAHGGEGLEDHARDVQVGGVGTRVADETRDGDFGELGHVAEGDGAFVEGQGRGAARGA